MNLKLYGLLLHVYMEAMLSILKHYVSLLQTSIIPSGDDLDPDVLQTMTCLQCFKDRDKLMQELLNPK